MAAVKNALEILGQKMVVTAEQASLALHLPTPAEAAVRWHLSTLRECALQNQSEEAIWRLFFYCGSSYADLLERFGWDFEHQPSFMDQSWCRNSTERWLTEKAESGFYLLNFLRNIECLNRPDQDERIAALGDKYARASDIVVCETHFTNFVTHDGEVLLYNWNHNGTTKSGKAYIGVGCYPNDVGMQLSRIYPKAKGSDVSFVIQRRPDF